MLSPFLNALGFDVLGSLRALPSPLITSYRRVVLEPDHLVSPEISAFIEQNANYSLHRLDMRIKESFHNED